MPNPHPSLLSFTASIDPSIFTMFAKDQQGKLFPLSVGVTTVKGTISNHTKEDLDQVIAKSRKNPPTIQIFSE